MLACPPTTTRLHELVVENVLAAEPGRPYLAWIDGQRHGPPEDCGGIGGFYRLPEAIGDPEHEDHEEFRGWLGRDYDPDTFSLDAVNRSLVHLQRRRSKTAASSGAVGNRQDKKIKKTMKRTIGCIVSATEGAKMEILVHRLDPLH